MIVRRYYVPRWVPGLLLPTDVIFNTRTQDNDVIGAEIPVTRRNVPALAAVHYGAPWWLRPLRLLLRLPPVGYYRVVGNDDGNLTLGQFGDRLPPGHYRAAIESVRTRPGGGAVVHLRDIEPSPDARDR